MQFSAAPYIALVFNALVWGLSWWPFQTMRAAGLAAPWATAPYVQRVGVGHYRLVTRCLGRAAASALWLLALTRAIHVCFQHGRLQRRRGARHPAVLSDAGLGGAAGLALSGERPSVMGILRLVLAFAGMALIVVPPDVPWQRLLSGFAVPDVLGLLGGFFFAATGVGLRGTAGVRPAARLLAMFVGCSVVGSLSALLGYGMGCCLPCR